MTTEEARERVGEACQKVFKMAALAEIGDGPLVTPADVGLALVELLATGLLVWLDRLEAEEKVKAHDPRSAFCARCKKRREPDDIFTVSPRGNHYCLDCYSDAPVEEIP